MGVRDAIIITVLLSQSLCEARGKTIAANLLQGLLSSNPQLVKMLSNKLIQQASTQRGYSYNQPILNGQAGLVASVPRCSVPIASVPISSVPVSSVPVTTNGQYATPVYQQTYQNKQCSQTKIEYPAQYQVYQNVQTKEQQAPKEVQLQTVQYPAQYPVSYSVQQTQTSCPASKPSPLVAPASMVNPFLPAASPISALCPPTSSLLPPANPNQARSQFLRKVPIPPPCL